MQRFTLKSPMAFLATSALVLTVGLPMQASEQDGKIVDAAQNSYNFKTYLKDDNIKVASANGYVTLTGTVAWEHHKYLAAETVAGLPGVKSVDNQLTLTGDQPTDKSDAWITMKVKTALTFHNHVSAVDTDVNTVGGVVTLTGKADPEAQKQLTTEYAKDVYGVTEVRNDTVVSNPPKVYRERTLGQKVDDSSITAQIKTSLLFHKSTHSLATKVVTRDGVVTLHGEARNGAERDLVTRIAEDIDGVRNVHNRMTLQKS